jgi:hypothetical protein
VGRICSKKVSCLVGWQSWGIVLCKLEPWSSLWDPGPLSPFTVQLCLAQALWHFVAADTDGKGVGTWVQWLGLNSSSPPFLSFKAYNFSQLILNVFLTSFKISFRLKPKLIEQTLLSGGVLEISLYSPCRAILPCRSAGQIASSNTFSDRHCFLLQDSVLIFPLMPKEPNRIDCFPL